MKFFALSLALNLLLLALPLQFNSAPPVVNEEAKELKISVNFQDKPAPVEVVPAEVAEVAPAAEKEVAAEKAQPENRIAKSPEPEKPKTAVQNRHVAALNPGTPPKKVTPAKLAPAAQTAVQNRAAPQNRKSKTAPQNRQPAAAQTAAQNRQPAQNPAPAKALNQDASFCSQHVSCEPLSEVFPRKAKQLGLYGRYEVALSFSVDASGVQNPRAEGKMIFKEAALAQLKKRRCKLLDRRAAGCEFVQKIVYELKK